MKNFFNKKFSTKTKLISSAISLMFIVCFAITGTVAWLMDATEEVTDTFTYGKVDIELVDADGSDARWSENIHSAAYTAGLYTNQATDGKFKLIPGATIPFSPYVKVVGDSEACYVFIEIIKTGNFHASYDIADGWTELENENVLYRKVATSSSNQWFQVMTDNKLMVNNTLKNGEVTTESSITIKAYAIQADHLTDATPAGAWALIEGAGKNTIPNYTSPTN